MQIQLERNQMMAFPWECISCKGFNRGKAAYRHPWGRVCGDWQSANEDGSSLIAIHKERFDKLITALRTAVANEYKLDKEVTSYDDLLDAFRLALTFYKRRKG